MFVLALLGVLLVVQVFKVRMPDGVAARTDGTDIWLDDRLNEVQARCAIQHELEHIRRGHSTVQVEAVEMSVRYEVAKQLLPTMGDCQGSTLAACARNLGVTRQVLMDRAATFTDQEATDAGCMDCRLCPVIQARYSGHPSVRAVA